MNKCVVILPLIMIQSCKNSDDGYVNHQKWETGDRLSFNKLDGHPKSIKETSSGKIADTIIETAFTPEDYELSEFDNEGNLVYSKLGVYIDSGSKQSMWRDSRTQYTKEGPQTIFPEYNPDSAGVKILIDIKG